MTLCPFSQLRANWFCNPTKRGRGQFYVGSVGGRMYFWGRWCHALRAKDESLTSLPRRGEGAVHGAGVREKGSRSLRGCMVRGCGRAG